MIKRIAVCVLCFILVFSVCAYAQNSQEQTDTNSNTLETQEQMPVRGRGGRMGGGPPGGMRGNMQPPQMSADENGETMQRPQMPNGADLQQPQANSDETSNTNTNQNESRQVPNSSFDRDMAFDNNINNETQNEDAVQASTENTVSVVEFLSKYSTPVFSLVLLVLAFVFVIFYKRKNY